MFDTNFYLLASLTTVITLLSLLQYARRNAARPPYPPGPKPLPILGNIRDLPREKEAMVYFQWAKKYGDIFHVDVLGRHMIFLNTAQATTDLFDKRSSNYSDRTHLHMINDLMGWDWSFGMMPFGERWRKHRRMFDRQFRASQANSFWPVQQQRVYGLLYDLLQSSDELVEHLRHAAAGTIMKVIYGIDISKKDDRFITVAEDTLRAMAKAASPGAFLVDLLPILKRVPSWMPGAEFQRKAKEWKKTTLEMRNAPFEAVKTAMAEGKATPCFVSRLMNEVETSKSVDLADDIDTIKNCAGLGYAAGAESIVSALSSFFLAMVLYPDVQKKAQSELDGVCHHRLPGFEDKSSLPYVDAVCKEVLRWSPEAPLGLPHMAVHDDVYNGYFIPAGTAVVGNTWAILHNEKDYPEPFKFIPERFLPHINQKNTAPDPSIAAFGYGRRICPGRFMAEAQLWITISSILSVFNIVPKSGAPEMKKSPLLDGLFTGGMISHPLPFKCSIITRSQKASELIVDAHANAT